MVFETLGAVNDEGTEVLRQLFRRREFKLIVCFASRRALYKHK